MTENNINIDYDANFIKEIASFIEKKYVLASDDLSRLTVVFEGKRPAVFLAKELSGRIGKSFFPPRFFSIDEFVENIVAGEKPISYIGELESYLAIYKIAALRAPDLVRVKPRFTQFIPWAKEILFFIEQLDIERLSQEDIKGVQENASIGYDVPHSINKLLSNIQVVRDEYHKYLEDNNMLSRGILYKKAADIVEKGMPDKFQDVLFCGVFSYHNTETAIINKLKENNQAFFLNQGKPDGWNAESIKNDNKSKCTDINIYSAFDMHSESAIARDILLKSKDLSETVIVLPDTEILIPLLSSMSDVSKVTNVSMGYPVKRSSVCSLFDLIFEAQETRKDDRYYSKAYLNLLRHPFTKNIYFKGGSTETRILIHRIEEYLTGNKENSISGSVFLKLKDVEKAPLIIEDTISTLKEIGITPERNEIQLNLKNVHAMFFERIEKIQSLSEFADFVEGVLELLLENLEFKRFPLDVDVIKRIFSIIDEFRNPVFETEHFDGDEMCKMFQNRLDSTVVSFSGSPVKGLQVLGFFESRCLNFKNVIFLDMNESIIPKVRVFEPLIPREVMLSLGILKPEKDERLQNYHFKRLINTADKVHLIYKQSPDNEMSRFIEEIVWESQKKSGFLESLPVKSTGFNISMLSEHINIEKTEEITEHLKGHEFSASALNVYLHCPLRFYYQYVLNLREQNKITDEVEGKVIGDFLHKVFYDAFRPYLNKRLEINASFRKNMFKILEDKFEKELKRKIKSGDFLIKEMLKYRINALLDNEALRAESEIEKILFLEQKFKCDIKTEKHTFNVQAIIDRVDKLKDGSIYVLDYKSGAFDSTPKPSAAFKNAPMNRELIKKDIKSLQLPLYCHTLAKSEGLKNESINAGLYMMRKGDIKNLVSDKGEPDKEIAAYMEAVKYILNEIIDPDISFKPDLGDDKHCVFCPYGGMCR